MFGANLVKFLAFFQDMNSAEETTDKEPEAGFGIKISSIASTASESLEEEETTEKDGNKQPLETSGVSLQLSDSDNEKSLNKSSKETEEPREGN
jgi:hypothetical protein